MKKSPMLDSPDEFEAWFIELAAEVAKSFSVQGINPDERTVYAALRAELTVGDVMEICAR